MFELRIRVSVFSALFLDDLDIRLLVQQQVEINVLVTVEVVVDPVTVPLLKERLHAVALRLAAGVCAKGRAGNVPFISTVLIDE